MPWLHWLRLSFSTLTVRATLVALPIIAAAACDRPTPASPGMPPGTPVAPDIAAAVAVPLADARARLAPALSDDALTRALDTLAAALEQGDGPAVLRSLDAADRALEPLTSGEAAESAGPEVEAVRLLLAEARALVAPPAHTR